jgi:hypothetical protein
MVPTVIAPHTPDVLLGEPLDHWCQLNVKPLSKRDIQFSGFPSLTALPHPNPPRMYWGGNWISFSPLSKGGLRGEKRLWDKHLSLS